MSGSSTYTLSGGVGVRSAAGRYGAMSLPQLTGNGDGSLTVTCHRVGVVWWGE
jgi:hypothetical protein